MTSCHILLVQKGWVNTYEPNFGRCLICQFEYKPMGNPYLFYKPLGGGTHFLYNTLVLLEDFSVLIIKIFFRFFDLKIVWAFSKILENLSVLIKSLFFFSLDLSIQESPKIFWAAWWFEGTDPILSSYHGSCV